MDNLNRISFHRRLIILLIILTILLQGIIIAFNYFRQLISFESSGQFVVIFSTRIIIGFISSLIVAYPFVFIINYLNKISPWNTSVFKRISIQLTSTILISCIVSLGSNFIAGKFYPLYKPETTNIANDIMIYSVSNIILVTILEAWMSYETGRLALLETKVLRDKLIKVNYLTLKNQIEPHFLFNSMSVLSRLIHNNPDMAQKFVKEYTSLNRYIIETIEHPVSKLSDEVKFVESYIYLQQLRFGPSLTVSININPDLTQYVLPPMSLQVLIENAIKHNIINDENPLAIDVYNIQTDIYVRNKTRPKISSIPSTGTGQKNLISRYELISKRIPIFMEYDNYYIGILPVLNPDFELSSFAKSIDNRYEKDTYC